MTAQSSDLVIETWISQGDCGQKEQTVVKEVAKTTARPQNTEDEIVTMVRRAKEAGVVPHALEMSCDVYKAIHTDEGVDYDKMLTIMTRQLRGRVEQALKRSDGTGARRCASGWGRSIWRWTSSCRSTSSATRPCARSRGTRWRSAAPKV